MSNGWLSVGTAHRSPVQRTPITHLLVIENGDWRMWCTSGKGREDNPHGNRLCRECKQLATEGVGEGTIDPDEVRRWIPEEVYAKAKAEAAEEESLDSNGDGT